MILLIGAARAEPPDETTTPQPDEAPPDEAPPDEAPPAPAGEQPPPPAALPPLPPPSGPPERGPGEQAPPDPTAGERSDGRMRVRRLGDGFLWVPRVLLAPPRYLLRGLSYPTKSFLEYDQRHMVTARILALITSRDGLVGIRPVFVYTTNFLPTFGLHFFHDRLLGPGTSFDLEYVTLGAEANHAALYLRPTPASSPVAARFSFIFDRRLDRLFSGIGSTAPLPPDARPLARYGATVLDLAGDVGFRLAPVLGFGLRGQFGWRRFRDGIFYSGDRPIFDVYCPRAEDGSCASRSVDPALAPGFDTGTQFLRAGAGLRVDSRDSLSHPTSGLVLGADADYTHGLGFDHSSYFRLRGTFEVVLDLWQRSRILVLRASATAIAPLGSYPVPFSELSVLGGPEDLRGFLIDRFRGESSFIATAEYRWPIWMWMDGSLFVDYGGVFGRWWTGFGTHQMQPDVGAGVRLRTSARFYLRLQVAYGFGNGVQLVLSGTNTP